MTYRIGGEIVTMTLSAEEVGEVIEAGISQSGECTFG
jgi:hypothetical protein